MRESKRKNLLQRGRWLLNWHVKSKVEPAIQRRRCSGDSWSISFISFCILILIWNLNMKCNTIMKYSFNQNQTIPKHIKKEWLLFASSYKNSILQKEAWLTGRACLNNYYLIVSHLWKNTNYKAFPLERMSTLTLKYQRQHITKVRTSLQYLHMLPIAW